MIDTVKIQSPPLGDALFDHLIQELDFATKLTPDTDHEGEKTHRTLYEISTGSIPGSYDHTINARLNYEDKSITFNGSIHKAIMGHNICNGPTEIAPAISWLIADLSKRYQVEFPPASAWRLLEIHIAEVFPLDSPRAVQALISVYARTEYARRKPVVHGCQSVTWKGVNSTIKFYHKGPEFRAHDAKRLAPWFRRQNALEIDSEPLPDHFPDDFDQMVLDFGEMLFVQAGGAPPSDEERAAALLQIPDILATWDQISPARIVEELANIADHLLRVEVEIKSKQLREWYGTKATLADIDQAQIEAEFWRQVEKITMEGKAEMEAVTTMVDVKSRLESNYGTRKGRVLFGTYTALCVMGEKQASAGMDRSTFYRHKRDILAVGIDWRSATLTEGGSIIPLDFSISRDSEYRLVGESQEVQEALSPYRNVA